MTTFKCSSLHLEVTWVYNEGRAIGSTAFILFYPEIKLSIALLSNRSFEDDNPLITVALALAALYQPPAEIAFQWRYH